MATEYQLKLKAILDDSDVQNKLSQLKKQQATQESGGQTGQGALGNIGQAIQRLNTSIANLEHAIEKLSVSQGKPIQSGTGMPAMAIPSSFSRGRASNPAQIASPLRNVRSGYMSTRAMARDIAEGFGEDSTSKVLRNIQHQFRNFSKHGWTAKQLGKSLMPYSDYTPVETFLEKEGKWVGESKGGYDMSPMQRRLNAHRQNLIKENPILARESQSQQTGKTPMSRQMKAQMRLGSALAFTAIAGGVENYAEATGQTGLKKGANLVQNVGMGAATGGLVGGPIGALIGGGIGALNTAFQELADNARDAADALVGQEGRVRSGRRFDLQMKDFEQAREDRAQMKKLQNGNSSEKSDAMTYFKDQLAETKKKYESVKSKMDESGIAAEGGLEAYEKKTLKLMELRGKDDAEVKDRRENADIYKDRAHWLQKHTGRIEQLEGIVEAQKSNEAQKPKEAKEMATSRFGLSGGKGTLSELILSKTKDLTRYGAMGGARGPAAAEQAELFKDALANLKAPDMTPVNSLASQGFMIGNGLGDETMLDETNKYLNEIAHLTREIKNKESEAATYG